MKRLMFAAAALVALGAAAEPVRIIFDTDMICDFDDVGALACLHALADAGECEILATVSSTRGNASVGAIQVINAYYGRAHLPVGAPKGKCVLGAWPGAKEKVDPAAPLGERPAEGDGGHYKYRKLIRDWPEAVTYPDADDAPDATSVYRRALASAPDRSVVVCSVGFLTNLRRLLETPPDDLSPLDGKALVARKVVRWVAMACSYPDGLEYNAEQDAESTRIALAEWPTPIVFSDFQYGYDVYAGRAVADLPGHNPVRDVFEGQLPSRAEVAADPAKWRRACYGAGGRSAWDETAVLAAVRGIEPYFNVRRGAYRIVGPKGEDEWVPDEENGSHLRLTEKVSKAEIGRILDDLMCRPPQSATRNAATVGRFSRAGYWDVTGSPRRVTSLNPGWTFSLDGFRTAKTVSLPYSIDEGEIGFAASGGVNRQQPAWYRKTLSWSGGSARQFLHFEAIMGKSRITLNGREVAAHFGGFLPIHVEVTGLLTRGENRLEVWCDNSDDPTFPPGKPQDQLDFAYFGGIYRDAYLVETGDAYVTDSDRGGVSVASSLESDGSWTVFAEATLGGATNGASARYFYDGAPVTPPFRPANPTLWSPEAPNLHLLTVEVVREGQVTDAVGVRFGIRDFTLDADGLTLNGRRYPKKLIGVNRHQDYLFIGMALPNSLHWRDAKKYRDCGMTVIRNAHYPQDPAFMDACDELGLFVIVNTPGWQFWNSGESAFERRVYDDILKMVRRDRARPSLLMWEPVLNETRYPAAFATNAVRLVKRETRAPNYCASDGYAAGADVCDVRYWISVKGTIDARRPSFCREWGDFPDDWNAQNSSSRVALEWGEGPMVAQASHYMEETAWPSLKTLRAAPPSLFGATLWHGADHARGYHPDNFFGGILTYGRQKKYAWHAFKAALTDEPYVFVAHELAPYSPADIMVYSNCAYTATWLGKPFDPEKTKFRYWEEQRLTYDGAHPERQRQAVLKIRLPDGSEIVKERAKRLARIDLALDTEGLAPVADGSDLVALTATLADAAGTPRRYAREKVRFSVEGPAEIVGENPQETRWGEAIVLIRPQATATPRPITVRAELARRGEYARQNGFLTFTPGSTAVTTGHAAAGDARRLREVEQQQKDFNVKD